MADYTLAPHFTCTAAGVVARAYPAPRIITLTDTEDRTIVVGLVTAGDIAADLLNGMSEGVISGTAYDGEREDHITFDGAHGLTPAQIENGDDAHAVVSLATGIERLIGEVHSHELRTRLEALGFHPVLRDVAFGPHGYLLHLPPDESARLLDLDVALLLRLAALGLLHATRDGYMPADQLLVALGDERAKAAEAQTDPSP